MWENPKDFRFVEKTYNKNACDSKIELQALFIMIATSLAISPTIIKIRCGQRPPFIPNSSFLIPNYSKSPFVLPLLEAVCQFQQELFGREAAEE